MSDTGTALTEGELDLVFRAFGFHSAAHAETVFAEADARRAAPVKLPDHSARLAEAAADETRRAWLQFYARGAEERRQRSETGRRVYLAHLARQRCKATEAHEQSEVS